MKPDPFFISIADCPPCPNPIALSRPFPNLNKRSLPAIAVGIEVSRSPCLTSRCRHRRSLPAAASDSSSTFLCDGPSLCSYCGPATGASGKPWWAGQVLGYRRPWPATMIFFPSARCGRYHAGWRSFFGCWLKHDGWCTTDNSSREASRSCPQGIFFNAKGKILPRFEHDVPLFLRNALVEEAGAFLPIQPLTVFAWLLAQLPWLENPSLVFPDIAL